MSGNKSLRRLATMGADPQRPPTMSITMEYISVETAGKYLASCKRQRRIRWGEVARIARKIVTGAWIPTHQPIAFDIAGRMIDGQHRMWAIIQAGLGIYVLVARGCAEESITHIDRGMAQTASDLASRLSGAVCKQSFERVARAIVTADGFSRPSRDELAATISAYRSDLESVGAAFGKHPVNASLLYLMAACVRLKPTPETLHRLAFRAESLQLELEALLAPLSAAKCWNRGAKSVFAARAAMEMLARATQQGEHR